MDAVQHDSSLERLLADIITRFSDEELFFKKTVREIAWGYHDRMLRYGQILDPSRFVTDFIGVLTGVCIICLKVNVLQ